ncbi:hypothetical protein Stsp01_53550 [Streptomyces sp. NBRC 13847]|nr:hypothetical protein Stsp01_53550 [Streptomyces sp. NBRC 13847]
MWGGVVVGWWRGGLKPPAVAKVCASGLRSSGFSRSVSNARTLATPTAVAHTPDGCTCPCSPVTRRLGDRSQGA